jgi:hypothetical protein
VEIRVEERNLDSFGKFVQLHDTIRDGLGVVVVEDGDEKQIDGIKCRYKI